MDYADEREYNRSEKALVILNYILKHGSMTIDEAVRITGCHRVTVWRILLEIERVCANVRREDRMLRRRGVLRKSGVWVRAE